MHHLCMNVCVYEDLHGKKWLYTYGAILKNKKNKKNYTKTDVFKYLLKSPFNKLNIANIVNDTPHTILDT